MAKYLDQDGLSYFWSKINTKLSEINSGLGSKLEKGQISFALDETEENLVLTVGDNKQLIPISSLYDGVINSVKLVDNKLQITTTSGGTFEVDLSSLNVNDTTSTVTVSNQIQVTGTPLANIFNECGVASIDKGTDLQGLLEKLLCKEVWPNAISITNPEASIVFEDVTSTNSGKIYEVGEKVRANASLAATPISVSKVDATLGNLTYGYALAPADSEIVKDTSYTVPTVVNFTEGTVDISYSETVTDNNTVYVNTSEAGNKSFTVTQTPQNYTFSYSNDGITALYPANNLGNLGKNPEEHKQTIAGVSGSPAIDAQSTTINYTVKYKYYIGTATTDPTNKTTLQGLTKLAGLSINNAFLENSGTTTIVNEKIVVKTTNGESLYIAIPKDKGYTISSIKSSLGADVSGTLIKKDFNYNGTGDYELYKLPVIGGANVELKDIKITKK